MGLEEPTKDVFAINIVEDVDAEFNNSGSNGATTKDNQGQQGWQDWQDWNNDQDYDQGWQHDWSNDQGWQDRQEANNDDDWENVDSDYLHDPDGLEQLDAGYPESNEDSCKKDVLMMC